jgi:3-deoxy-7-phosphoheptulonate synthase
VAGACKELEKAGLPQRLMIDLSHSNSQKDYRRQVDVCRNVSGQVASGNGQIIGVMIESHLTAGRQDLAPGKPLAYGQSITDACIGWDESVALLDDLSKAVRSRRAR